MEPLKIKSFWDVMTWRMTAERMTWPSWIEKKVSYPPPPKIYSKGLSYTFINHASVLIQMDGINFLTDPIYSKRCSPVSFAGPKRVQDPGLDFQKLPKIDIVLISHNHYDHLDLPTLKRLEEAFKPIFIVGLENKSLLESEGLEKVVELDWWESRTFNNVKITFTPAQHFSRRGLFDGMKTLWGSFFVETSDNNFYFGGDTGYGKHFKLTRRLYKNLDLAFLPIGAYEPRWFMRDVHLNPDDAVLAHLDLEAKQSVGIHFATFQLTDEAVDQPAYDLTAALMQKKLSPSSFVVPNFGETKFVK